MLVTYIDDPEPWEKASIGADGRGLANNIRNFWQYAMDHDLVVAPHFVDPQADRSDPNAHANSPALRILSTNDEGILVNGVKAIGTASAFGDFLHLGVFFRPGAKGDQIIYGVCPANLKGITIVCRESVVATDPIEHPLASQGDELDATVMFDNVLIPWKYVFHIGNPDHAKLYPQRVFDWGHYYALVRQAVRAELLAGLAILMCEHLGTSKIEAVQARLAKIIAFQQTTYAHVLASEDQGFYTPGGLFKPDIQLFNWGRVYFLQNLGPMVDELIDLCGRSAIMFPTEAQWQNPAMRPWFEKLNKGATGEAYDRVKIARVIRDLYLTDWGARLFMFENFNGTPLQTLLSLTMKRAEFTGSGPFASFARKVCGIEAKTDQDGIPGDRRLRQGAGHRPPRGQHPGSRVTDFDGTPSRNNGKQEHTMAKQRISYVPLEKMDAKMRAEMERCQREGTPRPESSAIRAHVPACFWFFADSWNNIFRNGVLDHAVKELCRLYVSRSVQCEYCGNQRSVKSTTSGALIEEHVMDLLNFEKSTKYNEQQKAALAYAEAITWHLQHRRCVLGSHAQELQRAGTGRARLHDRAHARPAELAAAPQHRASPGAWPAPTPRWRRATRAWTSSR